MIFLTSTATQFKKIFKSHLGKYTLEKFNDGELFLKLDTSIKQGDLATVIAATNPPAHHFIELFFLLNTLQQAKKTTHLIFTYFGYARQDHPLPLVAQGAEIISNCFKQFSLDKILIIHCHSSALHNYLTFENIIPFNLYKPLISEKKIDVIVAPDKGAISACEQLAKITSCTISSIEKQRIAKDQIKTGKLIGNVHKKNVLIFDDLISTGKTLIHAAELLKKNGALHIYAVATHSLLTQKNTEEILKSPIEELWVTNTIKQKITHPHFHVLDIGPELKKLVSC
ncbi:TPA: hypothetical protein DIC20_05705 [Candidatus Dependentiae bacterium]|nr:MAG: Ribose-phosphate pyrophosphokinase [candidate division TM6 bacterium GW2011_GWF2_36_131]KKQ02751.1 MAG: Ribose-phosphate pyrophosphokinase [candidate division TM6 bacterium GW2011_GWE2_36_25]KKQ19152.1 MAG: Ribose-phosphate pyrophosphokinase [candidate division TM6 bacterium GW2011_GWA2_36_9]HBR70403.1 hypothetical protein [Candidatus Dependentiae bacterium]HCU01160.1 hypothetical protein [Candidatus Dependentiae bacterium]